MLTKQKDAPSFMLAKGVLAQVDGLSLLFYSYANRRNFYFFFISSVRSIRNRALPGNTCIDHLLAAWRCACQPLDGPRLDYVLRRGQSRSKAKRWASAAIESAAITVESAAVANVASVV